MPSEFIRNLHSRIGEVEKQKQALEKELALLKKMAAVPEVAVVMEKLEAENRVEAEERGLPGVLDVSRLPVWKAAREILAHHGQRMRIEALTNAIISHGKQFGGRAPEASLSAHVSQHEELEQRRGYVYLSEWIAKEGEFGLIE